MPYLPTIPETYASQQVIDEFRGYNHNLKIGEGEFYDMKNLTSSYYPLLANRAARSTAAEGGSYNAVLGKSKLAYIDGSSLWYGGQDITAYLTGAGCFISTGEAMLPKQLVSMGAYMVIWPDKLYFNTENYEDCGRLEASFSTVEGSTVEYSICKADGTAYENMTVGAAEPEEPENGALWIDTSGNTHGLKQYSEITGMWVDVATVYTKIECAGIGKQFSKLDGVTISGCGKDPEPAEEAAEEVTATDVLAEQLQQLNGSKILYDKGDDYIVVVGLLDQFYTQTSGVVTVERRVPDLDFITEAQNRLWGCKYGLVDGKTVNEIYCCALGDFKNWNQFLGLATDSYVASVGTDGPWTGAVTHLGYPIFFKENCLHKVYISSTGAHQIVDTACRGVQKGSHNSLAVVNEVLYYKAVTDVMRYDGSLPEAISSQMGTQRFYNAAAGALGDKYYISMADRDGGWNLFVYDTLRGFWHREDDTHALQFARCGGELYYMAANALVAVTGSEGEAEEAVEWMAETGLIGYADVEQKYVSRLNLRMKLPLGSAMDMYMEYDSDGVWHHVGHVEGTGTNTFMIPVRPRRCDHFRFRMEGSGDVRVYSFAKILETGSDMT